MSKVKLKLLYKMIFYQQLKTAAILIKIFFLHKNISPGVLHNLLLKQALIKHVPQPLSQFRSLLIMRRWLLNWISLIGIPHRRSIGWRLAVPARLLRRISLWLPLTLLGWIVTGLLSLLVWIIHPLLLELLIRIIHSWLLELTHPRLLLNYNRLLLWRRWLVALAALFAQEAATEAQQQVAEAVAHI